MSPIHTKTHHSAARATLFCFAGLLLLTIACDRSPTTPTNTPSAASSTTTTLSLASEPVSFVGGQPRIYTLQNATFRALSLRNGGALEITVRPTSPSDRSGPWTLLLGSPFGRGLTPGIYFTTAFVSDAVYGFQVSGAGSVCDGAGTVTIHEHMILETTVQRFRASFSVRCTDTPATVRGDVVILADSWR